jgi:hypothetical protein
MAIFFQLTSSTASIGCHVIRSHVAARVAAIAVYHFEAPQNHGRIAPKMWLRRERSESDPAPNPAWLAKAIQVIEAPETADGNQSLHTALRRRLKG